jgi:hypothetical protein
MIMLLKLRVFFLWMFNVVDNDDGDGGGWGERKWNWENTACS